MERAPRPTGLMPVAESGASDIVGDIRLSMAAISRDCR